MKKQFLTFVRSALVAAIIATVPAQSFAMEQQPAQRQSMWQRAKQRATDLATGSINFISRNKRSIFICGMIGLCFQEFAIRLINYAYRNQALNEFARDFEGNFNCSNLVKDNDSPLMYYIKNSTITMEEIVKENFFSILRRITNCTLHHIYLFAPFTNSSTCLPHRYIAYPGNCSTSYFSDIKNITDANRQTTNASFVDLSE